VEQVAEVVFVGFETSSLGGAGGIIPCGAGGIIPCGGAGGMGGAWVKSNNPKIGQPHDLETD
jgi:hypothetical protein